MNVNGKTKDENAKIQAFSEAISMCSVSSHGTQKNEAESTTIPSEDKTFTLKICKNVKIHIFKPLISLKLALFLWFGAGSIIRPFFSTFLRQRGMTLLEFSLLYAITPVVQTLGPILSGIVADKLGKSKPVLVVNILLTIAAVVCLLLVPRLNSDDCVSQLVKLKCHHQEFDRLVARSSCDITMDSLKLDSCNVNCPENVTEQCKDNDNLICELLAGEHPSNFSLSANVDFFYKRRSRCYYNVSSVAYKNISHSWCNIPHKMNCKINCTLNPIKDCSDERSNRSILLGAYYVIIVLFYTFFSNGYRFMDVTSMVLCKEHNSDFGRERFFSIMGVLVISPFAGYIVDATTVEEDSRNYESAMYLFIALLVLSLIASFFLKVQINPPGKRMLKKTLTMVKNPDISSFALVVFVLGTAWGFTKIYSYLFLEELKAPSYLMGLIPAAEGIYGLPFYLTSNWWVKKIGPTNIFILGLLGYVMLSIGYSFLYDPWLSIIIESTSIVTYHLLWVAVILYSHSIAPEGMTATVIATAGGIHFSVGKGTGSLIGGTIMSAFGGRIAFRVIAMMCLIFAAMYAIYLYIRRRFYS
ncbi:uncharacterized protein LOC129223906 [Uloborus diversus]|uniref:uncharacterized protein LOC129223906 n=1 Tax=Uloborus diversus TaxID=327109 RepID=UPI00240964B0|nr:uncharacterized protein LOC129223906 [Uloborus diversus]